MNKTNTQLHKESILEFFGLYADKESNPVAHKHMAKKLDELTNGLNE